MFPPETIGFSRVEIQLQLEDTTGFSRVELQFQPTSGPTQSSGRYHRLQPRGVSISTYKRTRTVIMKIPRASVAWSFSFNLQGRSQNHEHTTGFSRVESHFRL